MNDTLTISCNIPSRKHFYGDERDIFSETSNSRARWSFRSGSELIGDQELIVRKGELDGPFFVDVYDPICDCYEFEADLILSEVDTYNIFIGNVFDFIGENCDRFFIESNFPWINEAGILEFEVEP